MSLHFYYFVKTHTGNPHALGPRASFHPAQAAERRGFLSGPFTSPDLRKVLSVEFTKPMIPQLLSDSRQQPGSKGARVRPRRPGEKQSASLKAAPAAAGPRFSLPTPHRQRNPTRILAIRLTLRLRNRSPTPVGVPQSGSRDSCHLHFLLGSLFASFRKALVLPDRHGAAQRAKRLF